MCSVPYSLSFYNCTIMQNDGHNINIRSHYNFFHFSFGQHMVDKFIP